MAAILLVDDETGILEALSSYLRMQGVEVVTAASVAEARRCLETTRPSRVVCDGRLPDGTGRELIETFLGREPEGRAVLYTADAAPALREWLTAERRVELMAKPVRPSHLLAWLQRSVPAAETGDGESVVPDVLAAARLAPEELDRCMLALLPFRSAARVESVCHEGSRIRMVLARAGGLPDLATLPAALGTDAWCIETDSGLRVAVVVPLPWRAAGAAVDLRGHELRSLPEIVTLLERARAEARPVANLTSWHALGLRLSGREDLLPLPMAALPPREEATALWAKERLHAGG